MTSKPNLTPTEEQECYTLSAWLRARDIKHTHIPNETYTTSWNQKRKNRLMGVNRGVPDYMIFIDEEQSAVNRAILIFVEMKRRKGSAISDAQRAWLERLKKVKDVDSFLAYGAEEAIETVSNFLK